MASRIADQIVTNSISHKRIPNCHRTRSSIKASLVGSNCGRTSPLTFRPVTVELAISCSKSTVLANSIPSCTWSLVLLAAGEDRVELMSTEGCFLGMAMFDGVLGVCALLLSEVDNRLNTFS